MKNHYAPHNISLRHFIEHKMHAHSSFPLQIAFKLTILCSEFQNWGRQGLRLMMWPQWLLFQLLVIWKTLSILKHHRFNNLIINVFIHKLFINKHIIVFVLFRILYKSYWKLLNQIHFYYFHFLKIKKINQT